MHFLYSDDCLIYHDLNKLLSFMNISADKFEEVIKKLNIYKLIGTFKKEGEDKYIFILKKPLSCLEFANDELLAREYIKKVGGEVYQTILSGIKENSKHYGYKDISYKNTYESLNNWNDDDETYLVKKEDNSIYNIDSFFDINEFLKGVSLHLFPMKYRTFDILKNIASLADLYNVSFDKMKTFLPKVTRKSEDKFDMVMLKKLCAKSTCDYKEVAKNKYDVPCVLFLMNLQNGLEVTEYDRKIIYELSYDYHLKPEVINVLLEHSLKKYDNRLIEKYIISIASDMHRNNISTSAQALARLDDNKMNKHTIKKTLKYDDSSNEKIDLSGLEEYRK